MRLYEYEAKQLLREQGIAVPNGLVASTPEEVGAAVLELGGNAVVKAQALAGGRGKAGLIRLVSTREEAEQAGAAILEATHRGERIEKLLVEERVQVARELYLSISVDRLAGCPVILACAEGGVEIEEVAATRPETVVRRHVDVMRGLRTHEALQVARDMGLKGDDAVALGRFLLGLYAASVRLDTYLLEVNPLVVTAEGKLVAADAKVILDDDAAFRQPFYRIRNSEPGLSALEREGREKKLSYVDLDGTVALMGNGAGLVLSLLDLIRHFGATPANFLDTGGGASRAKAKDALGLVLKKVEQDPRVKSILLAFSLSISLPEDAAGGVLDALAETKSRVPVFAVVHGTRAEVGEELLRSAGVRVFPSIHEATRAAATA